MWIFIYLFISLAWLEEGNSKYKMNRPNKWKWVQGFRGVQSEHHSGGVILAALSEQIRDDQA